MPNFRCQVVIPTRELFNGEVSYAQIPGDLGDYGVLAGHEKIVATNRPGIATVTLPDGKEKISFALYSGVTQMADDMLIVMGRMGCRLDDIDAEEVAEKAEAMRGTIEELQKQVDADASDTVIAKLETSQERLAWYETQLRLVNSR